MIYNQYKKLIEKRIERGGLTEEFIEKTTTQLDYYLTHDRISKEEYDELIKLMYPNE